MVVAFLLRAIRLILWSVISLINTPTPTWLCKGKWTPTCQCVHFRVVFFLLFWYSTWKVFVASFCLMRSQTKSVVGWNTNLSRIIIAWACLYQTSKRFWYHAVRPAMLWSHKHNFSISLRSNLWNLRTEKTFNLLGSDFFFVQTDDQNDECFECFCLGSCTAWQ